MAFVMVLLLLVIVVSSLIGVVSVVDTSKSAALVFGV